MTFARGLPRLDFDQREERDDALCGRHGQESFELDRIDGLQQVMIKPRLTRALVIVPLSPAGQRDQGDVVSTRQRSQLLRGIDPIHRACPGRGRSDRDASLRPWPCPPDHRAPYRLRAPVLEKHRERSAASRCRQPPGCDAAKRFAPGARPLFTPSIRHVLVSGKRTVKVLPRPTPDWSPTPIPGASPRACAPATIRCRDHLPRGLDGSAPARTARRHAANRPQVCRFHVSATLTTASPSSRITRSSILPPCSVYLAALDSRFENTCVSLSKSPSTQSSSGAGSTTNAWPCSSIAVRDASALTASTSRTLTLFARSSILPVLIRPTSRRSSTRCTS